MKLVSVAQMHALEKEAATLRTKLADARAAATHRASLEKKLEGLREVLRKNNQDVEAAKAKAADAARVAQVALESALAAAGRAKASGDPRLIAEAERVLESLRRTLQGGR